MDERPSRYSVCPHDGDPLVTSLEVRQCEWVCEGCGRYFPMFRPTEGRRTMTEHSLVELSEPLFTEHPDGTFTPSTEPYRWRCRCGATAEADSAEEIKRLAFAHIPQREPGDG